jgi:hypothetical protein
MKRSLTTNSRLVNELFASYISTFAAFCELVNNSIQAEAKNIYINIDYTPESELSSLIIKKIEVKDDGNGVHLNDIDRKLLDIGTNNKEGGKGIGRFSAFQIGRTIEIETVGYCNNAKTYTKATIPLNFDMFSKNINVSEVNIETQEEILKKKENTYYKVTVSDLYDSTVTEKEPKKKIIEKFLEEKIQDAIFERYPLKIFNKDVTFTINGKKIKPEDFVIEAPTKRIVKYTDKKGKEHSVLFNSFQIKNVNKIKVFLTTKNAGIDTIANGFEYDASWLSPKIGGWFIYISGNTLPSDIYRNVDLDGLDENVSHYREFVKNTLNDFFREMNKEFDNFSDKLKNDIYYPFKKKASSQSKVLLFDKLAYLVEDKYHLLNEQNKLREIVYPLIDRTISNGDLDKVLREVLRLNDKMISKFATLIDKSELEDIIEFSDRVASKLEDLEFLEKLVYSEIAKNIKERKELHKYLEKMLWIFGEEYSESTKLLSDKGLEKNLLQLRDDILTYKQSKTDDNITEITEKPIKSITDLFLYSERILDSQKREVLVVELKAPKVKISRKELGQVMKYAEEIESKAVFPDGIRYKIILVSSDINSSAKFDIKGRQKGMDNPYFYFRNEIGNIEVWVLKWSDILENVKRKLKYMANALNIKDIDVQEKAQRDFEEIQLKVSSTLRQTKIS